MAQGPGQQEGISFEETGRVTAEFGLGRRTKKQTGTAKRVRTKVTFKAVEGAEQERAIEILAELLAGFTRRASEGETKLFRG